jgi:type IV secretion system protein VirD4
MNYQKLGKELMSQDEIAVMDGSKCIMMLRGVRPFLSKKYDITKHPRYKYLSDFDKANTFDVEKYLERLRKPRPPVKPDEPFFFFEIEDEPGELDTIEDTDAIAEIDAE